MEVFAKGKNIPTYSFNRLFTQGEIFADTISFVLDRFYNGIDIYYFTFVLTGVNESNGEAIQALFPEKRGEDKIVLKWSVGERFTKNSGKLELEIRASNYIDMDDYNVIKYNMQPVYVNESPNATNSVQPDSSEQLLSQIYDAVASGLEALSQMQNSFNLAVIERRLNKMESDTAIYLSRPEVIALTKKEYDAIVPKTDSLYVILGGE